MIFFHFFSLACLYGNGQWDPGRPVRTFCVESGGTEPFGDLAAVGVHWSSRMVAGVQSQPQAGSCTPAAVAAVGLGYVAVLIRKLDEVVCLKGNRDETGKLIVSRIEQEAPFLKHLRVNN